MDILIVIWYKYESVYHTIIRDPIDQAKIP
jgi:hypothetical protein